MTTATALHLLKNRVLVGGPFRGVGEASQGYGDAVPMVTRRSIAYPLKRGLVELLAAAAAPARIRRRRRAARSAAKFIQ